MPQVNRSDQAELDLIDILVHLGRHSPAVANRFADEVERKCQLLAQFPGMGTARDDLRPGLRAFAVGSYVIFYQTADDGIRILRILHGARNLSPSLFNVP